MSAARSCQILAALAERTMKPPTATRRLGCGCGAAKPANAAITSIAVAAISSIRPESSACQ